MYSWEDVMQTSLARDPNEVLSHDPHIEPEDNATIIFTSGTCVFLLSSDFRRPYE
jgi:long-subunit acyl-CoA synthetase (AMP-forming)